MTSAKSLHVVALSGGKDSTAMALRLAIKEAWKCVRAAKESLTEKRVDEQQKKECCCQEMGKGNPKEHCQGCPVHNENPKHGDDDGDDWELTNLKAYP